MNERRARKLLEDRGYYVLKSGGSFGIFDLIAVSVDSPVALCIQVKSNRPPGRSEMDKIKAFLVPDYCRKQVWILKDRCSDPTVLDV
jgi:Holliday junction resolvase hjc